MALELSDLGIRADCAPDLDLRQSDTHDAIGDRAFGYSVEAVSALAPGDPATVAGRIISDIIRGRIGFDGLLMTDDLGMDALGGSLAERGTRALAAGCDVLLQCSGLLSDPDEILSEMEMIVTAAGPLAGEAKRRADKVEASIPEPEALDHDAAWARFHDLVAPVSVGIV